MLTAVNVELRALSDGRLPYGNSLYIHALFFKLINEYDPDFSNLVHNKDGFKPYTLSVLRGGKKLNWEIQIIKDKIYIFRATFMDDRLFFIFYEAIYSYYKMNKDIKIGKLNFMITQVDLERNERFEDLTRFNLLKSNKFELNFLSPTSFRVKGRNYLFPDSSHILRSYFDKWHTFCPVELKISEEELDNMTTSCFPVKHALHTELLDMGNYKIVGFKGKCMYEIDNSISEETFAKLNWLLKFSRYSGTGYKTTMGMGQTKISAKK